jgi:hypothetical protein
MIGILVKVPYSFLTTQPYVGNVIVAVLNMFVKPSTVTDSGAIWLY